MLYRLAKFVLWAGGWRAVGTLPDLPKFVVIGAPHTSNWDWFWMLPFAIVFRTEVVWMVKHTVYRWPFKSILRRIGAIPIDRRSSHNVVEQAIQAFENNERLVMLLTPEGTRKRLPYWKSGFYHIARGANVPIVLGFLDYKRKVGGVGPTMMPTGDIEADMKVIRDFYAGITAKHPEKTSDINVTLKG